METHSNILAWKITWTEEPGGLQSRGSQKESDTTEHMHTHPQTCRKRNSGANPVKTSHFIGKLTS